MTKPKTYQSFSKFRGNICGKISLRECKRKYMRVRK